MNLDAQTITLATNMFYCHGYASFCNVGRVSLPMEEPLYKLRWKMTVDRLLNDYPPFSD